MHDYAAPKLTKIGSITDLTLADAFAPGQDGLSWLLGGLVGTHPDFGS